MYETKFVQNLCPRPKKKLSELSHGRNIALKKADKWTTSVMIRLTRLMIEMTINPSLKVRTIEKLLVSRLILTAARVSELLSACKIASSGQYSGSVRTIKFLSSKHFWENHPKSLDRAWQKWLPGKKYSLKKRLSEIKFDDRETAFQQRNKYASVNYYFLLYKIKYRPTLSSQKEILKGRWHFRQYKQHLKKIYLEAE